MGLCGSKQVPLPVSPVRQFHPIMKVVIELDQGRDEILLPMVGKNYPPAEPPMKQDFKPPVKWYNDDDDEYKPEEDVYQSTTSLQETDRRLTGHHDILSAHLAEIDSHAKTAKRKHADTFEGLLEYLTAPIKGHHKTLLTVRAIAAWLASQNIDGGKHGPASNNSPNGYLQLQKEKRATFTSFFAVLCRSAGIECTVIHGTCKGGDYQPGDTELQECLWVAVLIENTWQIIHPFWVCRAMIGQTVGGWIKLESDGKTVTKVESSTEGMIEKAFKETYFMPKPEDFKYICYPDESEWQLLPPEKIIKSKTDFLRLPFLLPAFFGLGLTLLSQQTCELDSQNGLTEIVIKCKKSQTFKMIMTYDLFVKDTATDDEMIKSGNLPRLVLNSRTEEKFTFRIRFPVEGTYKIVFYAGVYEKPLMRVCEFKLNCAKRLPDCRLLPINTGIDGWGPGPKSEKAGLILPSQASGVIHLQAPPKDSKNIKSEERENTARIKFSLNQRMMSSMDYSAVMVDGEGDINMTEELNRKNVSCKVDNAKKELNIEASIPNEGEYALVIRAGKKGKPKRSVCNYLLTTLQGIREGVPQRKARKALKAALTDETNLDDLANLINKCKKVKISENDDDVRAAKARHTFLLVKSHIDDCHKRRNLDVTMRTLAEVSKYRHKLALILETKRAEKLKQQLERLGGFTRDIPELNKACEELEYINNPKIEVLNTMNALCLLLDEPTSTIGNWAHIQSLLKLSKEHNNNLLNRMKGISDKQLDTKTRRKIETSLHEYTENQVRHVSQAAASFYIWIDGVLKALGPEKTEMDISGENTAREETINPGTTQT